MEGRKQISVHKAPSLAFCYDSPSKLTRIYSVILMVDSVKKVRQSPAYIISKSPSKFKTPWRLERIKACSSVCRESSLGVFITHQHLP